MHFSDSDLKQLSADRLGRLTALEKEALLVVLLEDLKEARERLRTNSQNSSKPPSSDPPWKRVAGVQKRSREAAHAQTRALAREFLNDWEAIFRVLARPFLPFTNKEAQRALRHWVIVRRITQGSRTPEGTRAVSLLASIIATCRKRNILPWPYLATVIADRRKGKTVPALPAPICA